MGLLKKDEMLSGAGRPTKDVEVVELGGSVRVTGLSAATIAKWQTENADDPTGEDGIESMARLIAICAIDESGAPVFDRADAKAIGESMSFGALNTLAAACFEVNGLGSRELEAAEADLGSGQG
tara:strand:+ start:1219 stop:1590 length:372 start_codon:yes stop_codon:yes gene_type:complete